MQSPSNLTCEILSIYCNHQSIVFIQLPSPAINALFKWLEFALKLYDVNVEVHAIKRKSRIND